MSELDSPYILGSQNTPYTLNDAVRLITVIHENKKENTVIIETLADLLTLENLI